MSRGANGLPEPAKGAVGPHSRLQFDAKDSSRIYSATEFDAHGNPVRRIDFAARSGQDLPHSHEWDPAKGTFSKEKVPLLCK